MGILLFSVVAVSMATAAEIPLERTTILDYMVEVLVPKELRLLTEEEANVQYPFPARPALIYTSKDNSISLTFNHTQTTIAADKISEYKDSWAANYKKYYPAAEWLGDETIDVNGKKVGYVNYLLPYRETKKFNLVFFAEVDGRLLVGNFGCRLSQMDDWKPVVLEIMNSLTVVK